MRIAGLITPTMGNQPDVIYGEVSHPEDKNLTLLYCVRAKRGALRRASRKMGFGPDRL